MAIHHGHYTRKCKNKSRSLCLNHDFWSSWSNPDANITFPADVTHPLLGLVFSSNSRTQIHNELYFIGPEIGTIVML